MHLKAPPMGHDSFSTVSNNKAMLRTHEKLNCVFAYATISESEKKFFPSSLRKMAKWFDGTHSRRLPFSFSDLPALNVRALSLHRQ